MDLICGTLALIVLVFCLIFKWQFSYWARRKVQGPAPLPIFGNYFECFFMQKHFVDVIDEIYGYFQKAKYVGFYKYHMPCLVLKDIELVNRVLSGDLSRNYEPDFTVIENIYLIWKEDVVNTKIWKQKSIQPEIRKLLTRENFNYNYDKINAVTVELLDLINEAPNYGQFEGFEAKELTTKYTLECLVIAAIHIKANCIVDESSIYLNFYRKYFTNHSSSLWMCFMKEAISQKSIEAIIGNAIKEEIQNKKHTYDSDKCFFDSLIAGDYEINNEIFITYLLGLMEAFEMTNTLMAYCLYQLALNDDIQRKVRAEILENLYLSNGELTDKILESLQYLDAVLFETLRLHSHLFALNMRCKTSHSIPAQFEDQAENLQIDEGVRIVVPIYSIHLDQQHYQDPNRFNPERYLNIGDRNKMTYPFLEFGKDSQYCLGMVYAFLQTKLGIAKIISNKDVRLSSKTSRELNFSKKTLKLFYEEGIWLDFWPVK